MRKKVIEDGSPSYQTFLFFEVLQALEQEFSELEQCMGLLSFISKAWKKIQGAPSSCLKWRVIKMSNA